MRQQYRSLGGLEPGSTATAQLLPIVHRCIRTVQAERNRARLNTNCLESLYQLCEIAKKAPSTGPSDPRAECLLELAGIMETVGCETLDDCLSVCVGPTYLQSLQEELNPLGMSKLMLLLEHTVPIGVRYISYGGLPADGKILRKNRPTANLQLSQSAATLCCFDMSRTHKEFGVRVKGMEIVFRERDRNRITVVSVIADGLWPEALESPFLCQRKVSIQEKLGLSTHPTTDDFKHRVLESLSLKDYLVYSDDEILQAHDVAFTESEKISSKSLSQVTNEFLTIGMFAQRKLLLQMLLRYDKCEFHYMAYLLYDLLSPEDELSGDSKHQKDLLDSMPWAARQHFKDAMASTVCYTEQLAAGGDAKIPLAQRICLMKANERTKEKAMAKLREVKAKSEDSGSKARQYLDGLLRIPFGIYRNEAILSTCGRSTELIKGISQALRTCNVACTELPTTYTAADAHTCVSLCRSLKLPTIHADIRTRIARSFVNCSRATVVKRVKTFNDAVRHSGAKYRLLHSGKSLPHIQQQLQSLLLQPNAVDVAAGVLGKFDSHVLLLQATAGRITQDVETIEANLGNLTHFMQEVGNNLDSAVHGHTNAKRQIQRIIAQWMSGKDEGYCFGFEGPPGVGKTSLAKEGIAACLKDSSGLPRPFSLIAIGGASNASTLDGHNYTYVGSTWGRILDTVMEAGCLNPIIFIDELDKVSKTEHGKEIIGILTHMIDPSQNESFQDKYFSGVDVDLSKALIIFSYNDASSIDRILLDRIHRVKFDPLTLAEKLTITDTHLLPDILEKTGLSSSVVFEDGVVQQLIDEYTSEPGVRALKEVLFEIVGEINLTMLEGGHRDLPITVSKDMVVNEFLSTRRPHIKRRIATADAVGNICGLWANSQGHGGVLPIQASYTSAAEPLTLRLTGMQGDVMKESMDVARTVALHKARESMTSEAFIPFITKLGESKESGFHIHVPDGATPKDGPSAGTAIAICIYSLLTNRPIKRHVAITGEICLRGHVGEIGGLDLKIIGAARAGVKVLLYPAKNEHEYLTFRKKHSSDPVVEAMEFIAVESFDEAIVHLLT